MDVPCFAANWEFALRNVPQIEDLGIQQLALTARSAARLFAEFGFDARGATTTVEALLRDWLGLNLLAAARRSSSVPLIGKIGLDVGEGRPPEKSPVVFAPRLALQTSRGTMLGLAVLVGKIRHPPRSKTRIEARKPRVERTILKLVGDRDRARVEAEIQDVVQALRRSHDLVIG